MKKLIIEYHGVMYSDYFSGTHGVMLSIPVDRNSTVRDVFAELKEEINILWDHIEYTFNDVFHPDVIESMVDAEYKRFEEFTRRTGKQYNLMADGLDYTFDELEDVEEPAVVIFTIEMVED